MAKYDQTTEDTDDTEVSEEDELVKRFKADYRAAKKHQSMWLKNARENYDFVAGRQLTEDEKLELEELLRPHVTFNRVDPVVSAVIGHQINNRQELKYLPRTQGDAQPNEILSGAAKYVDDESDALDEITDAFWDTCVCGIGWTETHIEYDEDDEGKIYGADRVDPKEMGWDPTASKRNLVDKRFVFRERKFPKAEAYQRWPELKNISLPDKGTGWLDIESDTEFDDPRDDYGDQTDAGSWYDQTANTILIVQYQYYDLENVYKVGDALKNRIIELDEDQFKRVKSRIEKMNLPYVKIQRRKYKQCYFAGPNVLEEGPAPASTGFTFNAITGKRDNNKNLWYGLVEAMKDPQKWSNKVFSDITSIMYKNRTGGAFVEEDALVDPRKAEEQWAEESPLILCSPGAISKGKILERNPMNYPAGLDRLMEFAVQAIPQVTGISMELMGLVDRNQPGVLEMQRKRAGMTILAILFDSLKRYHKERGRIMKSFIDDYISDGRLIRIVGGDGMEKYVPLIKDKEVMKYDIVVSEAPTSPNQKDETFLVLRELVPQMAKLGVTPPEEMIDFLPLPSMLIQKWKQQIAAAKDNPMTKRVQELEIAEREAAVEKTKSEAKENESQVLLNQVKAMVEKMQADLDTRLKPIEQLSQIIERSKPQ